MRYCTFKYTITYLDGSRYDGWTPFRGASLELRQLEQFVRNSFQELKPAVSIDIYDVFEISDARIWIAHIRGTVEFRYLYMTKGFAGDLLQQFFPQDVKR